MDGGIRKIMISSTANQQIRQVSALTKKAKMRRETGLFVVEGLRMFEELTREQVQKVYASESFLKEEGHMAMVQKFPHEIVSDDVFKYMSDTQSPQGILALVKQPHYTLEDILKQPGEPHLMILETLQDPGNLGTVLRAGEGAGIPGVIMNETTADIFNPKVIRSTMGSIYRVPFVYVEDLKDTLKQLKAAGVHIYAAHLKGKNSYDLEDYKKATGFLIGNEANGLSDEIADLAETYIRIPMLGRVESLNAAVAASVLMFETARQRRDS